MNSVIKKIIEAMVAPLNQEPVDINKGPAAKCRDCKTIFYMWEIAVIDEDRDEYICTSCTYT